MTENEVSRIIVDTCYKIHTTLGPGLFESVYEEIIAYELGKKGLKLDRQFSMPVIWKGFEFDHGFRADILLNRKSLSR